MKLRELANEYLASYNFTNLHKNTQNHYKVCMGYIFNTELDGIDLLGNQEVNNITVGIARDVYESWCSGGRISFANHNVAVLNILFNYGLYHELCKINPLSVLRKRTVQPRKVVWCREDVLKFLTAAYGDFSTRNVGLIAHMAYEWCQRVGDMRMLKWDQVDLEKRRVTILQSKRQAQVELPIEDDLCSMLTQQAQDWDFQDYVAPNPIPKDNTYIPYDKYQLPNIAKHIRIQAGLSKELRLSDLRRTGIVEMVDAEVGTFQIMSVSGHKNPQSVKPYLKNTYASANNALSARYKDRDNT